MTAIKGQWGIEKKSIGEEDKSKNNNKKKALWQIAHWFHILRGSSGAPIAAKQL